MTIITTYVAFDGTKFDDEFDCLDYEFTLQMKDCKLRAYDSKRHRVNNWYDIDGYSDVHRIMYLLIKKNIPAVKIKVEINE